MKQKPRLTLEVLVVSLLVLCGGFAAWLAVLLPARLCWLPLALLAVGLLAAALLGRQIRALAARWTSGRQFEDSRLQYSLADLPVPALVLLGKAVLWYNDAFRSALLGGDDCIMAQASRAAPGLNLRAACSARQCGPAASAGTFFRTGYFLQRADGFRTDAALLCAGCSLGKAAPPGVYPAPAFGARLSENSEGGANHCGCGGLGDHSAGALCRGHSVQKP